MKKFSPDEMIIRATSPDELATASVIFCDLALDGATLLKPGALNTDGRTLTTGHNVNTIEMDGKAAYLIVWHKDVDVFHCNVIAVLGAVTNGFERCLALVKNMALTHKCTSVLGVTVRRAFAKKLLACGFVPRGVVVSCPV